MKYFILKYGIYVFLPIMVLSCNNRTNYKTEELEEYSSKIESFSYEFDSLTKETSYDSATTFYINPLMKSQENIEKGKVLFQTYCKHCHGLTGMSDAPMVLQKKYPPPPVLPDHLPTISEGQMFYSIYYGKNQMPRNINDLSKEQIWQLVTFIQTLKKD